MDIFGGVWNGYMDKLKEGMAVIMISHDPEKALQSATHVLHLGREMLYSGPVAGYDRSSVLELEKKGGSLWRS
jgi:ABC-type Mn2+/Zn2+ transport system ATPase subunit